MTLTALFKATLAMAPRLAATLRNAAATPTAATVLDGIFDPEEQVFAPGDTVQQGVRQFALLAEGLDFAPAIGMTLEIGGTTWGVLDVRVEEPTEADTGAAILYRAVGQR